MARPVAILKALALAYRRDWTAFQSLAGNNFFLITAFLLRTAGTFVYLIMGLVVLFPLSTDPLRKIPPSRLALWPLERRERWILRLASPWINPLTWGLAGLAVWGAGRTVSVGLWAAIAGLFAGAFLISAHAPAQRQRHVAARAAVSRTAESVDAQESARDPLHAGFLLRADSERGRAGAIASSGRHCRARRSWR